MSELHLVEHPIVVSNLTAMRSEETSSDEFRRRLRLITAFLGYEATRGLPLVPEEVQTPVAKALLPILASDRFAVVAILRAGIGMVDGMLDVLPSASVGFIGMERDETTHKPREYYFNVPEGFGDAPVFAVDPMLATGGSAIDAVDRLKAHGCKDITLISLLAAPDGIAAFQAAHPDVDIYTAAVEEGLNDKAYILPGLGDAGDRIFNSFPRIPENGNPDER